MSQEERSCRSCKGGFTVTAEDAAFYESMQVPAPEDCPKCRMVRRFAWRNERNLYKRECDLCGRSIVSIYSPKSPYIVYCNECFHGDGWDPMDHGAELDFSRPFLEQFKELQLKVPRLYSFVFKNDERTEYVNGAAFNKNSYLIFVSDNNEDSLYSYGIMYCKNTMDCFGSTHCELCYEAVNCTKCFRVKFSEDCSDCSDVSFSKNCSNCQDCVGCVNLKNKRYHIFNEPYSKEEYFAKVKELALDTREGIARAQAKLAEMTPGFPVKYLHGNRNVGTTGDYIHNSKASARCYEAESLEDCRDINFGYHTKNTRDAYVIVENSQFSYEVVSGIALNNAKMSYCAWTDFDVTYCDTCENSNNLFGCVGLRKKQYCILNKQYSKEEYETLTAKIVRHMQDMPYKDDQGEHRYGRFFPVSLSPFGYNETAAQEEFPTTPEEAEAQGFAWRKQEGKGHKVTMSASKVPESAAEVGEKIVGEVIGCAHEGRCNDGCSEAFKVTNQELQFYKQMNLPLPVLCWQCRHMRRRRMKNPPLLQKRKCECGGVMGKDSYKNTAEHFHGQDACPNEFETTYSPDRPEIVYCEACYQAEVS